MSLNLSGVSDLHNVLDLDDVASVTQSHGLASSESLERLVSSLETKTRGKYEEEIRLKQDKINWVKLWVCESGTTRAHVAANIVRIRQNYLKQ